MATGIFGRRKRRPSVMMQIFFFCTEAFWSPTLTGDADSGTTLVSSADALYYPKIS